MNVMLGAAISGVLGAVVASSAVAAPRQLMCRTDVAWADRKTLPAPDEKAFASAVWDDETHRMTIDRSPYVRMDAVLSANPIWPVVQTTVAYEGPVVTGKTWWGAKEDSNATHLEVTFYPQDPDLGLSFAWQAAGYETLENEYLYCAPYGTVHKTAAAGGDYWLAQRAKAASSAAAASASAQATAASIAPTLASHNAAASRETPTFNPSTLSADAELSYRGALVAALLSAIVAGLITGWVGWSTIRVMRRQLLVSQQALEHARQQTETNVSVEERLRDGPRVVVERFAGLVSVTMEAASRNDRDAFLVNAKALAAFCDSLHGSLVEAAKPLNSNMQALSRLLSKRNPDIEQAMRLVALTEAQIGTKAIELEMHLRQLMAAIDALLSAKPNGGAAS